MLNISWKNFIVVTTIQLLLVANPSSASIKINNSDPASKIQINVKKYHVSSKELASVKNTKRIKHYGFKIRNISNITNWSNLIKKPNLLKKEKTLKQEKINKKSSKKYKKITRHILKPINVKPNKKSKLQELTQKLTSTSEEKSSEDILSISRASNKKLSSNVINTIGRILKKKDPQKSKLKHDVLKLKKSSTYKQMKNINIEEIIKNTQSSHKDFLKGNYNSSYEIRAFNPNLKTKKERELRYFDYISNVNYGNMTPSSEEGNIVVHYNKSSYYNVLGTIRKQGYVNVNFSFGSIDDLIVDIPLFDNYDFSNFLNEKNSNSYGGFLLVNIDTLENIQSVEIDSLYDRFFYLSEDWDEVELIQDAMYVLFVGVKSGNTLLTVATAKGDSSKVLHIYTDEVTYDFPMIRGDIKHSFSLYERNLMGRRSLPIEVGEDKIKLFNSNVSAIKKGVNDYFILQKNAFQGERTYLEYLQSDLPLFFGLADVNEVDIPSAGFIENLSKEFEIYSLQASCMIQINLNKKMKSFEYQGYGEDRNSYFDVKYLDRNGLFYSTHSPETSKIFLYGNTPGIVNILIKYHDGTEDLAQTYCSDETYLLEQF